MKGGTAINLYVRDTPRLSVDIDLAYLPLESRDTALANIDEALHRIAAGIQKTKREKQPESLQKLQAVLGL